MKGEMEKGVGTFFRKMDTKIIDRTLVDKTFQRLDI